jgi:hypothetical protein
MVEGEGLRLNPKTFEEDYMNSKEQNKEDLGTSKPSTKAVEPADKISKNLSASYKEAYGQKADPTMGTNIPAGKNRGENDTLTAMHTKETVKEAHATPGATLKSVRTQSGKHMDNMSQTKAGNAPDEALEY